MFKRGSKLEHHEGSKTKKLLVLTSIAIVVLAGVAGYFIWRTLTLSASPAVVNEQKTASIMEKVGKIYELPAEQATVAQINNKEKLKDQKFFTKAKDGDYLLVYTQEKMAIIYREETNKIINAGPVGEPSKKD